MTQWLEQLFPLGKRRDDEYLDPNTGLVTCKNCHMPRQKRLEAAGMTMTVRCLCRCEAQKQEREEQERKARELRDRIQRLRSVGLPDRQMRQCTFANDRGFNPRMDRAKAYVEHWKEMEEQGMGLMIYGGVGTGKSFMAGCIANALIDQGVSVLMTNFNRILNELPAGYSEDKNARLTQLNHYRLLIIDDFGAERSTEYATEVVHSLIDARIQSGKPLIVTTNLSLEDLHHPDTLARSRIFSRVLQHCAPVLVSGRDLRSQDAAENLKAMKEILNS